MSEKENKDLRERISEKVDFLFSRAEIPKYANDAKPQEDILDRALRT